MCREMAGMRPCFSVTRTDHPCPASYGLVSWLNRSACIADSRKSPGTRSGRSRHDHSAFVMHRVLAVRDIRIVSGKHTIHLRQIKNGAAVAPFPRSAQFRSSYSSFAPFDCIAGVFVPVGGVYTSAEFMMLKLDSVLCPPTTSTWPLLRRVAT
jgi:hypothetical protein